MTGAEVIAKVKELGLPEGSYVVYSPGIALKLES